MMAALLVRHHFVRLYGLATNVVVLDEIHAYDAYMSVVLERLVEWLGALRTPVVLLSATLPASKRRAFEDAYHRGAFAAPLTSDTAPNDCSYPLVSVTDRGGRSAHTLATAPQGYKLRVELLPTEDPIGDVLPRLVDASRHGRVAWIRNTVTEAQAAWDAARSEGALLFHARMRTKDRAHAEKTVLEAFGARGKREKGLVIATQVIEQSLDLDFDLLVSDLAPIDLLLQRAGRLHRHLADRPRPAGFDRRLIVVEPRAPDVAALRLGPSRYVYDAATLWLAHDSLAKSTLIVVPADVRDLVEASYDPGLRASRLAAAENANLLADAETKRQEKRLWSEHSARACAIPPVDFDPQRFRTADDDDEIVQALTREGRSVTLLPVLWDDVANIATTLDGQELSLDAASPRAWLEATILQDEQVSVPSYRIQGEAPASGDLGAYEAWSKRAHTFTNAMRIGRHVVMVPMREQNGLFSGHGMGFNGLVRVLYTTERGLSFT
jgi:CRISPR-associated endonuclease/helicase Cas3